MGMTSEDDKTLMFHNNIDSPLDDDANCRDTIGGNGPLKKGPWTSAEDAILIEYVTKNGGGNWNAVQKNSGLARCGKSCRLRWTNHLRPNLKKCAFSPEEEQLVIELHAKMGNKWARMADQLPGRTDNEIKNFWNTRIKRLQRAGLPIYPPGTLSQSFKEENQQSNDETTFSSQDAFHPDFIPFSEYQFQTIEFKGLKVDDEDLFPTSAFVDDPQGRFRGSEHLFPPCLNGVNDDSLQIVEQPFVYSSPYDHNTTCDDIASSMMIINGKPSSSSEPNWATEMELPSIQTQMDTTSWGPPSSPMRSFESVDVQIQNPSTENALSYNTSYLNSALFDPVLYESQTMNSSVLRASNVGIDLQDNSSRDFFYTELEAYGEQMSPFGHSCSSVFSEGTPISRSSFDEPEYVQRVCKMKNEATTMVPMQYGNKGNETINEMSFSRPDMLFPCDWFFSPDQF